MPLTRARNVAAWIIAALALVIGGCRDHHDSRATRADAPRERRIAPTAEAPRFEQPSTAPAPESESNRRTASDGRYDLREIASASERAAVEKMIALIERGGPFRYRQDGVVFQNRESRLPRKERGYYREYTVATPRAKNRGARRIVRGEAGETYYTNDHYRSFMRLDH
jgi:ribonuclease T1